MLTPLERAMNVVPVLSICIPTYNRRNFLEIVLNSIIVNCNDYPIEVVVCDNASTDGTEEMVLDLAKKYPYIHLFRNHLNVSFDGNIVKVLGHAQGKYCWLLGSDDAITTGAFAAIFDAIEIEADVILADAINCDFNLSPIGILKFLSLNECALNFSIAEDVFKFLQNATMHASLFGYIGALIFKRVSALSYLPNKFYMGTGYIHVALSLDVLIKGGGTCHYLSTPIAFARRDNNDYAKSDHDRLIRHFIDYQMFRRVIDDYFSSDLALHNCYRAFIRKIFAIDSAPPNLTGIDFVDAFRKHFYQDALVLETPVWPISIETQKARERFIQSGWHEQVFGESSILQIGFRDGFGMLTRPINKNAVGYDRNYGAWYDGIHLPFESGTQAVVWICHELDNFPDLIAAGKEWLRVLAPGGKLAISTTVSQGESGPEGQVVSKLVSQSGLIAILQNLLMGGCCRILHCAQTQPVFSSDGLAPISDIDLILEKLPTPVVSPEVAIHLAIQHHQAGRLAMADQAYADIVAMSPDYFPALHMLGVVRFQQNQLDSAEALLLKAIAINGLTPEAHYNLGCVFWQSSRFAEARNCFERCLELSPGYEMAQTRLTELTATGA